MDVPQTKHRTFITLYYVQLTLWGLIGDNRNLSYILEFFFLYMTSLYLSLAQPVIGQHQKSLAQVLLQ